MATTAPRTGARPRARAEAWARSYEIPVWQAVVWDDPVNLMGYVTAVLQRHFGYSRARAHELMMRVHTTGRAVVNSGPRERIEADVVALHTYGLRATMEPAPAGAHAR
ncbi:ATP-dependent Clp protease adaptor protein ClpS [Actinomyces sp. oral taxon 178 str. F0338]|nr:ATP-dependent Clp protease adaptor protein ClpS [Actinomyces sp. oral taxon 178 str. F0338]